MFHPLSEMKLVDALVWFSCSPDGKYLVSLGNSGPARVWGVTSSTVIASLPKENVSNSLKFSNEGKAHAVMALLIDTSLSKLTAASSQVYLVDAFNMQS